MRKNLSLLLVAFMAVAAFAVQQATKRAPATPNTVSWAVTSDNAPAVGTAFDVKNGDDAVLKVAFGAMNSSKDDAEATNYTTGAANVSINFDGTDYAFGAYATTSATNGSSSSSLGANGESIGNYMAITPKYDGQLVIVVQNQGNKTTYLFEDGQQKAATLIGDGSSNIAFSGEGDLKAVSGGESNYSGGILVDVKAGSLYTISVSGSKGRWMGLIYKYVVPVAWKDYEFTNFNFAEATVKCSSNTSTDGDITEETGNLVITDATSGVKLTVTPNASGTTNRFWKYNGAPQLRVYGGTMTFEAPEGKIITKLTFNNNRINLGTNAGIGTLNGNVWTGEKDKVEVNVYGNTQLNSIDVVVDDANRSNDFVIDLTEKWEEDCSVWNANDVAWRDVNLYFGNAEYNAEAKAVRINPNGYIQIQAPDKKVIKSIVFQFEDGSEATEECFEKGAYADKTWTGEEQNIMLQNKKQSGLVSIQKMTVTMTDATYFLFTGGIYDMAAFTWNEENEAYEYDINPSYFNRDDEGNYSWGTDATQFFFAISDIKAMPGENQADDQAKFDYEHRLTIGAGTKVEAKMDEAMDLGNFASSWIALKGRGWYTLSISKDKKLTISEKKVAYAKFEQKIDEETGEVLADSLVFKYDNAMSWNNEWEIPAGDWTPDWCSYYNVRQTKKVVFDKSFADARPTSLYSWFSNFSNLETIEGIENLNASEAINMSYMFRNCYALKKIDLSKVNAEKVTNIYRIVWGCNALEELDLSGISTENVTSSYELMFANMNALKKINLSGWSNDNITSMYRMFRNDVALEEVNLTGFGTANVNSMYEMFYNCPELKTLDLSSFDLSQVTEMVRFLSGDAKLESVKFADDLNTENLSNTAALFENCAALKTIDLSKFNTQGVWDMNHMFAGCAALEELDLSTLNTQSVSYMYNMFDGCAKLKELDIVSFDVNNLSSMNEMFANCDLLETVYVSREFYNRGGGYNMFYNCPKIKNPKVAENTYDENIVSYQTAIDRYCGIAEVYYPGSVNAGKYMTYYINNDVQLVNGSAEGLKIATVTGICDTEVVAKELTIAASETPLLIYNGGDEAQNVKLVSAYKSSDKVDDVKPYAGFQGTLNGQRMAGSSDDLDYYICNGEEFVWVMNSGSVYANRCWLEIDKKLADAQGAQRRAIVFGDSETTGISIATADAEQNGNYYDLNGRQLQGKPAQKGLYILNGKKVVIK